MTKFTSSVAFAAFLALSSPFAFASEDGHSDDGGHDDHGAEGVNIGEAGTAADVTTTIEVVMHDNFYEPESISVKEGETVRFIIKNAGEFVHEFGIATAEMHEAHAPMMEMMVEHGVLEADKINHDVAATMQEAMGHGMHDEPNSVLLEPGKSGEIIWTFPEHVELEFACNVPGHYDGGMVGEIELGH
jgi:uncharacterized cupredoxin-like copper-binding protein